MPEPDPSAAIRTPTGAALRPGGLPDESPPFPVPDHTLIRRIGRGAYGEVWLARNALGTWRAVKFVRRSSFDDDRPFEREFAGIQRFEPISRSHESQLNILHVGRAEDGFYYVMELADDMGRGQDIDEATYTARDLRSELHLRGRLPAAECLRLGLALTTALEHLHKHGLVHRDIKPSNIVFVNGIPKLADIGLVARAEATISFVGTEGFLPPEGPGTRQADIYSLGKVLYELSTGHDRKQFPELPTNIAELSDRAELSELNEVLLRACHRDPRERYQTAAEMHADLALLESGRSVVQMRGMERRLRFVQRAGAVVTVIAALAAGLYLWQARQTRQVRELAEQNRLIAEEKTQLAAEKTSLAEANRERLVRLDIANGVRLLDEGDPGGALLWFTEALPLVTNRPSEENIHRIRIQQVLDTTPRLLQLFADREAVLSGAFSPDGTRIATGTKNGRLQLRNSMSGEIFWDKQRESKGRIGQLRFSRDGRRVMIGSSSIQANARFPIGTNEFLSAFDAETGNPVYDLKGDPKFVCSTFSPDGRWIAYADEDHTIGILNAQDGKPVKELKGHADTIHMLAFSADGNLLASVSKDKTARLWRMPSGEPVGSPILHDAPVGRAAFNPDGSRLATATHSAAFYNGTSKDRDCFVQTWEVATGRSTGPPIHQAGLVLMLTFDEHSGENLITADNEARVQVWNAETHQEKFPSLKMRARCWAFSPDGRAVAVGSDSSQALIWDLETGELLSGPFQHAGYVECIQFSPDGSRLLTTSEDGTTRFWSLHLPANSKAIRFDSDFLPNGTVNWARNSARLAFPLKDKAIRLVDSRSFKEIHRLTLSQADSRAYGVIGGPQGHAWVVINSEYVAKSGHELFEVWCERTNGFQYLTVPYTNLDCPPIFSPDETRLLTCDADHKIRVWRTSDGGLEQTVPLVEHTRLVFEILPDAKRAVVFKDNATAVLMDIASQRELCNLAEPEFVPESTAVNLQGTLYALFGGQLGMVFDLATGRATTPAFKHGGELYTHSFSPEGDRLLTAGNWGNAKIWDCSTGELLLQPMPGDGMIADASWSGDGRFIVTSSYFGKAARVWDATTAEPVTPKPRTRRGVLVGAVVPNDRFVTASEPNLLQAWDLVPSRLPPDVLADYAKLLSGRRLNAGGVLLPLKAEGLAELSRLLHTRAPQLFE